MIVFFMFLSSLVFSQSFEIQFTPAVYLESDIPKTPGYYEVLWVEGPTDGGLMDEFLRASMKLDYGYVKGKISASLRLQKGHGAFFTNLPGDFSINATMIDEAFLSISVPHGSVVLGRKKRKYGPMEHPLALSDNVPYFDGVDVVLRGPVDFLYSLYYLDPFLTDEEREKQESIQCINADSVYSEPVKIYQMHGLGFHIGNLEMTLREMVLIGGKYPGLAELNPLMSWHFLYKEGYLNSQAGFDFDYRFGSSRVYGEFLVDDIVVPFYERSDVKPMALAYGFGLKTENVFLEYAHTDDWVYLREAPYMKFDTRILRVTNIRYYEDYPIGFEYGPGADMLVFGAVSERNGVVARGEFLILGKKDVHMYSDYKSEIPPERDWRFGFRFTLFWKSLSLKAEIVDRRYLFEISLVVK